MRGLKGAKREDGLETSWERRWRGVGEGRWRGLAACVREIIQ